ncbi:MULTISPECIES: hypothetical protein [Candidatus Williamhamiltonella]|uniref:hypothetical protein n=1 Tax=Candidatus Williamhamiltonella TaxID=568987 RepID=UPI001313EE13|nr:hypothetical protein [Candidatus Hamiltonella defensa]
MFTITLRILDARHILQFRMAFDLKIRQFIGNRRLQGRGLLHIFNDEHPVFIE